MGYSACIEKDDAPLRNPPEKHPSQHIGVSPNLPGFLGRNRRFFNPSLNVNLSISKFCEINFEILLFLSTRHI